MKSTHIQAPSTREASSARFQKSRWPVFGAGMLEFPWTLDVVAWSFSYTP
jgi:hypothetical protein